MKEEDTGLKPRKSQQHQTTETTPPPPQPPEEQLQQGPGYSIEVVCRGASADNEAHLGVTGPLRRLFAEVFSRGHSATSVHPYPAAAATGRRLANGRSTSSSFGVPTKKNSIVSIASDQADGPRGRGDSGIGSTAVVGTTTTNGTGGDIVPRTSSVFDLLERRKEHKEPWKQKVASVMDSVPYTFITLTFTLMAVYADLIRSAFCPKSADIYFTIFTSIAITFFAIEILVSCIVKPKYFLRFFFWMDLLATMALCCDLPGFMNFVTPGAEKDGENHDTLDRSAKAIQAGARAVRLVQLFRMLRLVRAARIHKQKQSARKRAETEEGTLFDEQVADGEQHGGKFQSRIGETVTDRTMTKVILGVVLMLLVLPVFDAMVFYGNMPLLEDGGLAMLHDMYGAEGNTTSFTTAWQAFVDEMPYKMGHQETGFPYELIVYNNTLLFETKNLRRTERLRHTIKTPECEVEQWGACFQSYVVVDVKWQIQIQSILDIGRVTFLVAALAVAAILFIKDTEEFVLKPIERMVAQVRNVSQNPLARQAGIAVDKKGKQLETRILEHSIAKICSLLSVGFGEAGAEIIADNIKSGGDLNPMVPGRKVMAVFGFCDIRNFTDATEVLQEGVMEFVNSIAKIVHQEVALHGGAANKNIGDAFLLVWKLPGSPGIKRSRSSILKSKSSSGNRNSLLTASSNASTEEATAIADAALASFVIIQSALKRSRKLQAYSQREDLQERMPGFSIKMGFGLHVGWAIEGAIGSHFKIDASYLSPHVNTAARLEAATKQYNVPLLLSEDFVNMLSPNVRRRVRQIDCVTVKGSRQPTGLYTYDVSTAGISPPLDDSDVVSPDGVHYNSETYSEHAYLNEYDEHPDILAVSCTGDAFLARFNEGFEAYKAGDWPLARTIFEECRNLRRDRLGRPIVDGPSETLLHVMGDKGFVAPVDWPGYRELTEK